jgi:hypothetical protein
MDSRFLIEHWNYYDWLGIASGAIVVAMLIGGFLLVVDAGKRFVRYLKD